MELFNEYYNSEVQFLLNLFSYKRGISKDEIVEIARDSHVIDPIGVVAKLIDLNIIVCGTNQLYKVNDRIGSFAAPLNHIEMNILRSLCLSKEATLFVSAQCLDSITDDSALLDYIDRTDSAGKKTEILKIDRSVISTIIKAINEKRRVVYTYCTNTCKQEKTSPKMIPYRIEYNVFDSRWWLISYYEHDDRTIKSKLGNIHSMELHERHDVQDNVIQSAINRKLSSEPIRLRIFDVRNALERTLIVFENAQNAIITKISDNEYEFCFDYFVWDEMAIAHKVLFLGENVTVISPKRIIDILTDQLIKARLNASQ